MGNNINASGKDDAQAIEDGATLAALIDTLRLPASPLSSSTHHVSCPSRTNMVGTAECRK
jgi:hypothetical protein